MGKEQCEQRYWKAFIVKLLCRKSWVSLTEILKKIEAKKTRLYIVNENAVTVEEEKITAEASFSNMILFVSVVHSCCPPSRPFFTDSSVSSLYLSQHSHQPPPRVSGLYGGFFLLVLWADTFD